MAIAASTLINGAFDLIGVKQPGEALSAADAIDALRRLNQLVSGWQTQNLTTLAITRTLWPITADLGVYTIGPGGDFDTDRPLSVNGAGLLLDGLDAARSVAITRSSTTATVTLSAHGFATTDQVFITGATQTAYNGLQVITRLSASTFSYVVNGSPATPATGSPTAAGLEDNPVEIPVALLTDDAYQGIQIKSLTNTLFTNVYFNATQPLSTITLWPIPTTADNQLVLYLQQQFSGFADLTTEYTYPAMPGYADALEYNLAFRLCDAYGKQPTPTIAQLASQSLFLIKRQNFKLTDMAVDPAMTHDRRGGYNIQTGNY